MIPRLFAFERYDTSLPYVFAPPELLHDLPSNAQYYKNPCTHQSARRLLEMGAGNLYPGDFASRTNLRTVEYQHPRHKSQQQALWTLSVAQSFS